MREYTFLLRVEDVAVRTLLKASVLTAEGCLVDDQGRAWAQVHPETRLLSRLNGTIVACLIAGSGQGAPERTLRILQPLVSCSAQTLEVLRSSELVESVQLSLVHRGQVWASVDSTGQFISVDGQYVANLLQISGMLARELRECVHAVELCDDDAIGAGVAVFDAIDVRIRSADDASAAALLQSRINSDNVIVNIDGVVWAQADANDDIYEMASGRIIGRIERGKPQMRLYDDNFEVTQCSNDDLKVLLERVWFWHSESGCFMDAHGTMMAHVVLGCDQIQLSDQTVVGALRRRLGPEPLNFHDALHRPEASDQNQVVSCTEISSYLKTPDHHESLTHLETLYPQEISNNEANSNNHKLSSLHDEPNDQMISNHCEIPKKNETTNIETTSIHHEMTHNPETSNHPEMPNHSEMPRHREVSNHEEQSSHLATLNDGETLNHQKSSNHYENSYYQASSNHQMTSHFSEIPQTKNHHEGSDHSETSDSLKSPAHHSETPGEIKSGENESEPSPTTEPSPIILIPSNCLRRLNHSIICRNDAVRERLLGSLLDEEGFFHIFTSLGPGNEVIESVIACLHLDRRHIIDQDRVIIGEFAPDPTVPLPLRCGAETSEQRTQRCVQDLKRYDQFWTENVVAIVAEPGASKPTALSGDPIPDLTVETHTDIADFAEIEHGVMEQEFDTAAWQKAVDADKTDTQLVPLAYSRSKIEPLSSLVVAEIVRDYETLIGVFQGKIQGAAFTWLFLDGIETVLSKKTRVNLGKYLNLLPNLECLGLRKAGIRRLDKLSLPKLNQLTISYNLISDASALVNCVSGLPSLQILDFRENPILDVKGFDGDLFPLPDHALWQTLLVNCKFINYINGSQIDPARKSRAMALSKTKAIRNDRVWSVFLLALEQIPDMQRPEFEHEFAASTITTLDLHSKGMSAIWMHKFVHVHTLNLCGNELTSIENCGLEKMQALRDLNLSDNRLTKSRNYRNLNALALLGSLQRLWLHGNVQLKEYRSAVIFVTRHLRGTNRTLGLLELDEQPISIEERVVAVAEFANKREAVACRYRLNLILEYGHQQLNTIDGFESKITTLSLSHRFLDRIDVSKFVNLQVLNVARNRLSAIEGLQHLSRLRCLDASENPGFQVGAALKQLKIKTQMERVSVAHTPAKADAAHIKTLLTALLPKNDHLSVLEGNQIDFLDRMSCLARIYKRDKNVNIDVYRTNLAMLQCATPLIGRDYNYSRCGPGIQYQAADLTRIDNVSHLELKFVDLSIFTNLVVVNLSFNALMTVPVGLLQLQKLEQLDLRSNKISMSLKQLADIVDGLGALEVLHVRGNPFMRTANDRLKLIALINRMKNVECSLRIVDSPVSIDERVDSWLANGGALEQAESLRYKAAIFQRVRRGLDASAAVELDLSCTNIVIVQLAAFINLRKLNLHQNGLQRVSGTDIDKMTQLRVLDLGANHLSNLSDIVSVVCALPQLIFLTLAGNPLPDKYRNAFIHACVHFTRVNNKLVYLDETEVSVGEILANIPDPDPSFRFDLAVYRRTLPPLETVAFDRQAPILDREEIVQIDLSRLDLKLISVSDFSMLRTLRLSHNQIDTNALVKSGIEACRELQHLYLDNNQLTKFPKMVGVISKLIRLRVLDVIGNPCFPEASKSDRHKILKEWPDIEARSFPLRMLDGGPVTVRERIKAAQNLPANQIEERRLDLTIKERTRCLDNGEPDLEQTAIDLSNSDLQIVKQCFSTFRMLQHVNLNDNALTSLTGQDLETLQHLKCLRLCRNQFPSLDTLLDTLSCCHALHSVYLEQSTTDGRTKLVESYLDVVGFRLRGVALIDEQQNQNLLEGMQREAQQFLWNVAGVGPNQCVNVDISNKNIAAPLFFYVIAAMSELRTVTSLKSNGNQWNRGESRILNYRQYIVYGLGRTLLALDDETISDDERLNAIEFVQKEESRVTGASRVHKGGWIATRDKAHAQHHKLTAAQARKNVQGGPEFQDNKNIAGYMSSSGDAGAGAGNQIKCNLGAVASIAQESVQKVTALAAAPLLQVTGSVLVKFEIMINFLQMYSLIYSIKVNIPWPRVWINLSHYFLLFSIDVDVIFPLRWKDLAVVKYVLVLSMPLAFIGVYHLGDSIDIEAFRFRFVTNWNTSRSKAITFLVLWAILSICVSAIVHQENIARVRSGRIPDDDFNGLFATMMMPVVGLLFLWIFVAWRFRANCIGVEPNEFLRWWYKRTYFLRRVSLFALTILFMPVARVIMQQFQCDENHLVLYSDRDCPSRRLYPVQYTAFGFAAVYIVGLPLFFGRLISKATKMIDSHGYADESALYNELISVLSKQAKHDKDIRKKVRDAREHLDTFYANEVAQNPVPQTYLYGAYQRRFRYFKLIQMSQKLAIVLMSMFIPQDYLLRNSKLFVSNVIVFLSAATAVIFRPFQDKYESVLEILSQVANTANITTAILLDAGFPEALGASILVIVNGLSWLTFVFTVFATPIRSLIAHQQLLKQQRALQQTSKMFDQQRETVIPDIAK